MNAQSFDAVALVTDLTGLLSELISVVSAENESLRALRPKEAMSLVERKDALSRSYVQAMNTLKNAGHDALAVVPGELRRGLAERAQTFDELAAENARLLKAATAANQKVMNAIAAAVNNRSPRTATYNSSGTSDGSIRCGGRTEALRPVSLTLDRML